MNQIYLNFLHQKKILPARDGEQIGCPVYHDVNTIPSDASLSMFGVLILGCPVNPTSPYPISIWKVCVYIKNIYDYDIIVPSTKNIT